MGMRTEDGDGAEDGDRDGAGDGGGDRDHCSQRTSQPGATNPHLDAHKAFTAWKTLIVGVWFNFDNLQRKKEKKKKQEEAT